MTLQEILDDWTYEWLEELYPGYFDDDDRDPEEVTKEEHHYDDENHDPEDYEHEDDPGK